MANSEAIASSIPEFYETGPAIKKKMIALIESAADYLLIDSFLLSADETTFEVMEALKKKHASGLRIYVLADSSTRYLRGGREAFRFLEETGIPNAEYNPMRIYKLLVAPVMLPRDHRKFWIVDGKSLFLGGANIFSSSLESPEEGGNRDFMVEVESAEAVRRMIVSFVATWNESSRQKLKEEDFAVRARNTGETELWLADQNKDAGHPDVVRKMFAELYALAKKEIWLIQPYTFVTGEMIEQFRDLAERGVTVNLMLSGKVHSPRFHYASFYGIKDILEAGGKVWVYKPEHGPLHAKAVVVDGLWASVGSANLNARSYHLSKELNLVFGDHESVSKVVRSLEELKEGCRPVDCEEAEQYRGLEYYLAWLVMQVVG